jgi:hypothetical protein
VHVQATAAAEVVLLMQQLEAAGPVQEVGLAAMEVWGRWEGDQLAAVASAWPPLEVGRQAMAEQMPRQRQRQQQEQPLPLAAVGWVVAPAAEVARRALYRPSCRCYQCSRDVGWVQWLVRHTGGAQ